MAGRRGTSVDRDDDYYDDDDYSDDFDDDDDTGNKRYKTRSPILRTGVPKLSIEDTEDADTLTYRTSKKSKAGLSKGSGYQTPSEYETERTKQSMKSEISPKKPKKKNSFVQHYTPRSLGSRGFNRSNRGRGRGRGSQLNTSRSTMEPRFDNVAKRVMSARRLKINELMNQNNELKQQIIDIKEENRLLKKTQRRQDKALQKFEDQESDLPNLIQRQNNEVRSLKDQIRKWREKYEKTDRYLRDAEDELEKAKTKVKKLKSLADEKDLPERSDLNRKLNQSELDLEAKDVKIRELERHIKHLEKNHRHELGIERARQKDVNNQLLQLRDENDKLQVNVKEKEKEIQMKNIYANRMVKPPHRLPNSYNGTPHDSPPPRRRRPSDGDGITPRERAKQMEQKRREELRRQRELKQKKLKRDNYLMKQATPRSQDNDNVSVGTYGAMSPRSSKTVPTYGVLSPRSTKSTEKKLKRDNYLMKQATPRSQDNDNVSVGTYGAMSPRSTKPVLTYGVLSPRSTKSTEKKLKRDNYLMKQATPRSQDTDNVSVGTYGAMSPRSSKTVPTYGVMSPRSTKSMEQAEKLKKEQELRRQREEQEEEESRRRRRMEDERREMEEKEKFLNEQAERDEEERRMKLERERMKREAEDRERRERERKEAEERARRERREKEERERRERERQEQERRAQEERRRFEEDEGFQQERKKKDEILQKLREIDEGGQKPKEKNFNDPFFVTEGKEDSTDSMNSKKSYKFTRPIENMHKGKPARTSFNNSIGANSTDKRKAKKETDSVEIGGYNPSFGTSGGGGLFGSEGGGSNKPKTFSLFDDDEPKATAKPANKAKLLEDLFGSKEDEKSSNNDDIFASKPPPKKTTGSVNRSTFPWDDDSNRKSSGSTLKTKRENSSTLFGGGNAFVNDEDVHFPQRNNGTLPRRPKQTTTTIHTRPTVNAVDHFDDDIEEVIL